jgi:uncharacterized coiled-coil protein SlyX
MMDRIEELSTKVEQQQEVIDRLAREIEILKLGLQAATQAAISVLHIATEPPSEAGDDNWDLLSTSVDEIRQIASASRPSGDLPQFLGKAADE